MWRGGESARDVSWATKRTALRRPFSTAVVCLDRHDVGCLQPLRSLDEIELDLRALGEGAEALGLDRREVHEHILAVLRRDESKALRIVEPLDFTGAAHTSSSPSVLQIPCFQSYPEIRVSNATSAPANKFQGIRRR